MLSRMQVTLLLGFVVALWATSLLLHGEPLSWGLLAPFPSVVSALVVLLLVFDFWLWRLPILHPWLVPFQNLSGTWRGTLHTDWVNPKTLQNPGPIEVFLAITQTYSTLSMRMLTAQSASESLLGKILRAEDGVERDGSAIHHGAIRLRIEGLPASALEGEYWTDRDTKGEIRLTERIAGIANGFEHAQKLMADAATKAEVKRK